MKDKQVFQRSYIYSRYNMSLGAIKDDIGMGNKGRLFNKKQ